MSQNMMENDGNNTKKVLLIFDLITNQCYMMENFRKVLKTSTYNARMSGMGHFELCAASQR